MTFMKQQRWRIKLCTYLPTYFFMCNEWMNDYDYAMTSTVSYFLARLQIPTQRWTCYWRGQAAPGRRASNTNLPLIQCRLFWKLQVNSPRGKSAICRRISGRVAPCARSCKNNIMSVFVWEKKTLIFKAIRPPRGWGIPVANSDAFGNLGTRHFFL